MNNSKENQYDISFSVSKPTVSDLMGRQSVRATFRLSEACIDAISILAAQLGIKQKSVFDHLLEDDQVLKSLARDLEDTEFERQESVQKTFVMSRRSLFYLDTISSEFNAPRDALVEFSVRRLLPVIAKERIKHEKRKELFSEVSNHLTGGQKLLAKAKAMVGSHDPVVKSLETAMMAYNNALRDIKRFIDKGKIIEKFQQR
jgi:hypothetical protein